MSKRVGGAYAHADLYPYGASRLNRRVLAAHLRALATMLDHSTLTKREAAQRLRQLAAGILQGSDK